MKKLILLILITGLLSSCRTTYQSYEAGRLQGKSHKKVMAKMYGYKPYKKR
jgi:hypothetical protein